MGPCFTPLLKIGALFLKGPVFHDKDGNFLSTNNEHNEAIKPPLTSQLAVLSFVFLDLTGLCAMSCQGKEWAPCGGAQTRGQAEI